MAVESKVDDKQVWTAVEAACQAVLHHLTVTQTAQLEYASKELKPKRITAHLND